MKRAEEEVRKKLFAEEAFSGPFEVTGAEQRGLLGCFAEHQTHSFLGSGSKNHEVKNPDAGTGRCLGGCTVCARSFWSEDLFDMDCFVKPCSPVESEQDLPEQEEPVRDCRPRPRFAVQPHCAEKVNQLLSARRYGRRWPLIPKHELWASSIKHPHEPSWRWLLRTRRACEVSLDDNGTAPFVKVCSDCGHCLGAP